MLCGEKPERHSGTLHSVGQHSVSISSLFQHQLVFDDYTVTKLGKGDEPMRKGVIRAMHRHNVLTKIVITDHENRESSCADVIFDTCSVHSAHRYAEFPQTSHEMVLLVELAQGRFSWHSGRKYPSPLCAYMFYTK